MYITALAGASSTWMKQKRCIESVASRNNYKFFKDGRDKVYEIIYMKYTYFLRNILIWNIQVYLLQIYAPFEESSDSFHRTLFIFICRNGACCRTNSVDNFLVLRCQLPRKNDYYSFEPFEEVESNVSFHQFVFNLIVQKNTTEVLCCYFRIFLWKIGLSSAICVGWRDLLTARNAKSHFIAAVTIKYWTGKRATRNYALS